MKRSQSVSQQIGDKPSNDLLGLNLFQQHQSPIASNASTPTATHPYAPLQSPTLSVTTNSRLELFRHFFFLFFFFKLKKKSLLDMTSATYFPKSVKSAVQSQIRQISIK